MVLLAEGFNDTGNWTPIFNGVSVETDTKNKTEGAASIKSNCDTFKGTTKYCSIINPLYGGNWSGVTEDWVVYFDVFIPENVFPAVTGVRIDFGDIVSGPTTLGLWFSFKPTTPGWSRFCQRLKYFNHMGAYVPSWSNIPQMRFTTYIDETKYTTGTYSVNYDNVRLLSPEDYAKESPIVAVAVILMALGGLYLLKRYKVI